MSKLFEYYKIMIDKEFRDYICKKYGSYFRTALYPHENKFQDVIRNNFIESYTRSGCTPQFMVSLSYFREVRDLAKVRKNNNWMNKVLADFFNPRRSSYYNITKDHFIEQRPAELRKVSAVRVKNTITGTFQYDSNMEVVQGSYDTHHLIGGIRDSVIDKPCPRIKRAILDLYGHEGIPREASGKPAYERIKSDLIEYCLRERCKSFIGHSKQAIKVSIVDDQKDDDGFYGYKGWVAYVTKKIKTTDDFIAFYDSDNSDSFPSTKFNRQFEMK